MSPSLCYIVTWLLCLPVGMATAQFEDADADTRTVEVCQWKQFEPSCPPDTVIIITNAVYGRRVSHLYQHQLQQQRSLTLRGSSSASVDTAAAGEERCIERAYDSVDCLADVKLYAASRCSGRRHCVIRLPDAVLDRSPHGCPRDLTSNLEISYRCIPVLNPGGERVNSSYCSPSDMITDTRGYIGSITAEETGLGTDACPWTIKAQSGQTITLTVFDFVMPGNITSAWPMAESALCFAAVREETSMSWQPICRFGLDDRVTYVSNGNTVLVRVNPTPPGKQSTYLLINFEVTGCPDFTTPIGSVVERKGDTARIRCADGSSSSSNTASNSDDKDVHQRWIRLSCANGNWSQSPNSVSCETSVGSSFSNRSWLDLNGHGFLVVVVLGIALFVSFCIVIIGVFCLCRPHYTQRRKRQAANPELTYISSAASSTDRCAKHSSMRLMQQHGYYHQSPQLQQHHQHGSDYDPTWKEMQPMMTISNGKYSSAPGTVARILEPDYGGWSPVGWSDPQDHRHHHLQLSQHEQQLLERDYATTLQMRRTVIPSSVMSRSAGGGDQSSTSIAPGCVCPLHGLHPSSAVSVADDQVPVQRAWVGSSTVSDRLEEPAVHSVDGSNARFSTFRPRVEHIYEVPRFAAEGQCDNGEYDGVLQSVGDMADYDGFVGPVSPLRCHRGDARTFGSISIKLPSEMIYNSYRRK